ncbi:MAG: tRNA preQ1(34) S-adenosylmethionine ribosyltransferase-isomerase QueA [Armatimonadetes bacterium]|nr:tRNA preQ1(34) S-adenosylmethionine ribosyltransferase-isomerase QueA [Armatimonadota bacterium]
MKLSDFDYDLPEELIAQTPLDDRAASRMLVLDKTSGAVQHRHFRDIVDLLEPGDLLVVNDTRVSAVRLLGRRPTGGSVEALILSSRGDGRYVALMRPGKKLKPGAEVPFDGGLVGRIVEDLGGGKKLLHIDGPRAEQRMREVGLMPLPPYVHTALQDPERYQTVYGVHDGSAAAPTAGLHFTNELLSALREKGVATATVTLDVSVDTFRPVTAEKVADHQMHGERCSVSERTARAVSECAGRVVAVGTTTTRTLEAFATAPKTIAPGETVTKIFISPGYNFLIVDAMLTNFHMPRTSMLMMISAIAGRKEVMSSYEQAVVGKYRFLSFGDCMLIK